MLSSCGKGCASCYSVTMHACNASEHSFSCPVLSFVQCLVPTDICGHVPSFWALLAVHSLSLAFPFSCATWSACLGLVSFLIDVEGANIHLDRV